MPATVTKLIGPPNIFAGIGAGTHWFTVHGRNSDATAEYWVFVASSGPVTRSSYELSKEFYTFGKIPGARATANGFEAAEWNYGVRVEIPFQSQIANGERLWVRFDAYCREDRRGAVSETKSIEVRFV